MERISVHRSMDDTPEQKILAILYGSKTPAQSTSRRADVIPYRGRNDGHYYGFAKKETNGVISAIPDPVTDIIVRDGILRDEYIVIARSGDQLLVYTAKEHAASPCGRCTLLIGKEVEYAA